MRDGTPPQLPPEGRIHVIGAGGAGMSAVAKILVGRGFDVSASDLKPGRNLEALGDMGIVTWVGHRPDAVAGADLVVASSAVPQHDPEIAAARRAGVVVWMRPTMLEALTAAQPAIGVTGTHGKTTSTAMAVTALQAAGVDPTFIVGGEMAALNTGAHLGRDDAFVLEADEAFGTFQRLHLATLLVTNIEADHLDHYGSVASLEDAFAVVANRVPGPVVGCTDDAGVRRLAERATVVGFGTQPDAPWRIDDLSHGSGQVAFRLRGPDGEDQPVRVPLPGAHIARNAAGVLVMLALRGYDLGAMAEGLLAFRGVRRRFEVRGRVGGVTVVDDYAHHPTEVAATIAAGSHGGWNRVIVIFQPHRYSRTANFAPQFGAPLAAADKVIVTDVYAAGEAPIPGVSGRLVAQAATAAGGAVEYVPALGNVPEVISGFAEAGDLVLLLGAGDITGLAEPILAALDRQES